jgi:basic membrane protein A
MDSTQWNDAFTPEDYTALIERMYKGEIVVSNDISQEPIPQYITVNYLGTLR